MEAALECVGDALAGAGAGVKGQSGSCAFISYIWFSVGELYTADEMFSSTASVPCSDIQSHNSTAPCTALTLNLLHKHHSLHHACSHLCPFCMLAKPLALQVLQRYQQCQHT